MTLGACLYNSVCVSCVFLIRKYMANEEHKPLPGLARVIDVQDLFVSLLLVIKTSLWQNRSLAHTLADFSMEDPSKPAQFYVCQIKAVLFQGTADVNAKTVKNYNARRVNGKK